MVTQSELEQYLAVGHESRFFEVKGPGSLSDKAYCAKVARAVMAMGNLRDGGLVCLGIDEANMSGHKPGLDTEQFAKWSDFDDVSAKMATHSDPPVSLQVLPFRLTTGSLVVVLEVSEFDHVPHVCKRDYPGELQNGMTYIRPRGKPESVPVPSSSEMRELLDIATDKGVREFVRRARVVGILPGEHAAADQSGDSAAFQAEADEAWSAPSGVLEQIVLGSYFDVAVMPGSFNPSRLRPSTLQAFIEENTVRLRGWPVPYIDYQNPVEHRDQWIGQTIEPRVVPHTEAWRMCTSGQFLQRRRLATDLHESSELQASDERATGTIAVWDVLLYSVEIAELAARMITSLSCESVSITLSLQNIDGRQLVSGDWRRELHDSYITWATSMQANEDLHQDELLSAPREVGVRIAQNILSQFGAQLPDQVLMDWQQSILDRS